jgi:hypothetical protein
MGSFKKTPVKVVPVTAEIDGERVVVGEASLIVTPNPEQPSIAVVHLDTPEGLNLEDIRNKGLENAVSVSSDKADLVNRLNEQNKKYRQENPDDGSAAGNSDPDLSSGE